MSEYKIDGFRFDFTKGFSNIIKNSSDTWGSLYDAQRVANLKRMAGEIWKKKPGAIVIFEHLSDNVEEKELAGFGKGILMWGNMNGNSTEASMGYNENSKSDLSWASYLNRGWSKPSLVGYMESHDEERMMYKCISFGNATGSYNIKNQSVALSRIGLTSALFMLIPGPKMIWQFGELGYDISINTNGRLGEKPIHWEYKNISERDLLFQVFAKVFNLKKKYPIFSTSDFSQSLNGEIKWIKLNLNGEHVLIVGNFGVTSQNAQLEFQKTGTWYDFFGQKTFDAAVTSQSVPLTPGEYKLFSTRNYGPPITAVENHKKNQSDLQIFPNPAIDYVTVVSSEKAQSIEFYNLTGQKTKEFRLSDIPGNTNDFYIGDLETGIYLLKMKNSHNQIAVRKIIIQP